MHNKLSSLPNIPLGKYRHYRGNDYEVFAIGRLEATEEPVVIYRALYDAPDVGANAIWVRPVADFMSTVTINGHETPRFTFLDDRPPLV